MASITGPIAAMIPETAETTTATTAPMAAPIASNTGISFSTMPWIVPQSFCRDALIGSNQDCRV